jgi:hypothetical protein
MGTFQIGERSQINPEKRMDILRKLETTRLETIECFALDDVALARRYAPEKWSVRYILHHLADGETVLYDRILRTLCEDRPRLQVFDQDAWATSLDYSRRPLALSRSIFAALREGVLYHARLHYERDGHREFVHSQTGARTLREEIDKVASHNEHHLSQIRLAIRGS